MDESAPLESVSLSVFVSSPSELKSARDKAREVITQLSGLVVEGKVVTFEPMLWEDHTPANVGLAPQLAVDYFMGRADAMDIYVGMFWTTMGSAATIKEKRHKSGTFYEFQSAYKGFKQTGRPLLLLYRCEQPPHADSTPESRAAVQGFFDTFRGEHPQFEGFPKSFVENDDFGRMLRRDIESLARDAIQRRSHAQGAADPAGGDSRTDGQEIAALVKSVRAFLATFEDLFGKAAAKDQDRERDRAFSIYYRALPDPDHPEEPVPGGDLPPPGQSLLSLYRQWGQRMVFVGEKGTGKTFSVLQLMQELADLAARKPDEPVPVYFNLSSWNLTHEEQSQRHSWFGWLSKWLSPEPARHGDSLDRWLEDQMVRNYSMQRKAARRLIETNRLVFCLDGLDELGVGHGNGGPEAEQASNDLRNACARAINGSLANRAVRIVLCCREKTYRDLLIKPRLGMPLQPQLLSGEQVVGYLKDWPRLDGLRSAAGQSDLLQEKARVALFLGMMRIAYQDMSAEEILRATRLDESEWQRHLLDQYVQRCMDMAPPESAETNKDLIPRCLEWMANHPDNDFLLENMQPSVLRTGTPAAGEAWYKRYRFLSVTVLAVSITTVQTIPTGVSLAIDWGANHGLASGLRHGAVMFAISFLTGLPLAFLAFSARHWLRLGICFGLMWGIIHAEVEFMFDKTIADPLVGTWRGAFIALAVAAPCGAAFFSLLGEQFFGRIEAVKKRYSGQVGIEWYEIQPIEPMNWFWVDPASAWRGGWVGLIAGPVIGVITWLSTDATRGIGIGVLLTWLIAVCCGLSGSGIARVSIEPNQGMARSLRHALLMMTVCTFGGAFCLGIVHGSIGGLAYGAAMACLGFSLAFTFYVFGGIPVLRQFSLGHLLYLQGHLPSWFCWPPWRATVHFLDELVRYKLLRRSAGGYMFRHDTLREYYRNRSKIAS